MIKSDVFISYKSDKIKDAEWLKFRLNEQGVSCWMAPECIHGGSSYTIEIPKAIKECKVFLLVLSENVQNSNWISRELETAIKENKTVMPFMIEEFDLNDEFEFLLSKVQRYNAYIDREIALKQLLQDVREIVGSESYSFNEKTSEDETLENLINYVAEIAKEQDNKPSIINPVKVQCVLNVYRMLKSITMGTDVRVTCELNQPFKSMGSVSIVGKDIVFEKPEYIVTASKAASNMEVYPKSDGTVQINFTFHNLVDAIGLEE